MHWHIAKSSMNVKSELSCRNRSMQTRIRTRGRRRTYRQLVNSSSDANATSKLVDSLLFELLSFSHYVCELFLIVNLSVLFVINLFHTAFDVLVEICLSRLDYKFPCIEHHLPSSSTKLSSSILYNTRWASRVDLIRFRLYKSSSSWNEGTLTATSVSCLLECGSSSTLTMNVWAWDAERNGKSPMTMTARLITTTQSQWNSALPKTFARSVWKSWKRKTREAKKSVRKPDREANAFKKGKCAAFEGTVDENNQLVEFKSPVMLVRRWSTLCRQWCCCLHLSIRIRAYYNFDSKSQRLFKEQDYLSLCRIRTAMTNPVRRSILLGHNAQSCV